MYAQLGSIRFEGLFGFDRFSRDVSANIVQHAVIDGKPRLQKVGDNLDEVRFEMLLHSRFCSPEASFSQLQGSMTAGEILPLITGEGSFIGDFVVSDIGEVVNHTAPTGGIILSRVQVTLTEHATGQQDTETQAAKTGALAVSSNKPPISPFNISARGIGSAATAELNRAAANAQQGEIYVNQAKAISTSADQKLSMADKAYKKAQSAMDKYDSLTTQIQTVVQDYATLKSNIESAKTFLATVRGSIATGDVDGAINDGNNVKNALGSIRGAGASIAALTAVRRV